MVCGSLGKSSSYLARKGVIVLLFGDRLRFGDFERGILGAFFVVLPPNRILGIWRQFGKSGFCPVARKRFVEQSTPRRGFFRRRGISPVVEEAGHELVSSRVRGAFRVVVQHQIVELNQSRRLVLDGASRKAALFSPNESVHQPRDDQNSGQTRQRNPHPGRQAHDFGSRRLVWFVSDRILAQTKRERKKECGWGGDVESPPQEEGW